MYIYESNQVRRNTYKDLKKTRNDAFLHNNNTNSTKQNEHHIFNEQIAIF